MKTFRYFAYGSNLLASRIHIANPSAVFKEIAVLKNYRLDFCGYSFSWDGSPATIVPTENREVWGAVWEIDEKDQESLDHQENLYPGLSGDPVYMALDVEVITKSNEILKCRSYKIIKDPESDVPLSNLPVDRRPAMIYLQTIVKGAEDIGLPEDYIETLRKISHNGKDEKMSKIKPEVSGVILK